MTKRKYTINIDDEIHDRAVELAEKENRSFSNWAENLFKTQVLNDEKVLQKQN